jgi:two-component system sensor histidine kinase/response regulator
MAPDGRQALELCKERAYGLLLTDFHMPEMDGFELTRTIRAMEAEQPDAPTLPIVALTADALPQTEQQCLDAGMEGYLRKPIEIDKLEAALETYLPRALPLRVPMEPESDAGTTESAPEGPASGAPPAVDAEIFDPLQLEDSFGAFDETAAGFVTDFVETLGERITALEAAMQAENHEEARDIAHAMKGAANSVGAKRMGGIMADIQDSLDEDNDMTAGLFVDLLAETYDELKNVALPFCQYYLGTG